MALTDSFRKFRIQNPEKAAVIYGEESWSYAEFDDLTDRIASNFLAAGLEPGDRIAFHLLNGPELALGYLGCLKAGCVAVPVNTRLKGPEIDYVLRHSGSACYVGQPDLHADAAAGCTAIGALELRYLTGGSPANGTSAFDDLLRPAGRSGSLPVIASHQPAAILYTSGTTALPKGVTHSHQTLVQTAYVSRQMGLDQDQIALVISSMAHMIGFGMVFLSALLTGATVVITRPFDFAAQLEAYAHRGCTYTVGVPVMFQGLLQAQTAAPRNVGSGRFYFCGGDSVSPVLQREFQAAFGPICEAYGATEITPMSWNRPDQVRVGSIGQPGAATPWRLVDPEGREVKAGETGEICVQSPHLMTGYWHDPDATANALRNGWFHTGDLATCDAAGYYWFAGRKKEIIIRGGSNISPQEVESVLYQHPAVEEAGVVGRPDPVWGETVVAFVALRSGHTVAEAELIAFARERLADYKLPASIRFQDTLPRGPSGKIQRRTLRDAERARAL
jgi:long-chain acyl-CoA synthetase